MSTARDREIQELVNLALKNALGSALKLADPQSDVDIPPAVRAEVSSYLHSWVIQPVALALLKRQLGDFREGNLDVGVAEKYLEEVENFLDN